MLVWTTVRSNQTIDSFVTTMASKLYLKCDSRLNDLFFGVMFGVFRKRESNLMAPMSPPITPQFVSPLHVCSS
jgi:hypothetical protein